MGRFGPRRAQDGGGLRLVVIAIVSLMASQAHADDTAMTSLGQAERDVEASDYLAARTALVSALNGGNSGPAELAEIFKLSGIVEAALGNPVGATTEFAKWLVL